MTTKQTLLVLTLSSLLVACGSSSSQGTVAPNANTGSTTGSSDTGSSDTGSSDTGSSDTGSSDTGSSDTGSSDTGSSDTGSDTISKVESGYLFLDDSEDDQSPHPYLQASADDEDEDLNTITINGQAVTLVPAGISSGGFYHEDTSSVDKIVSGTKYSSLKFGAVDSIAGDSDVFGLFAHGFATDTDDMPTSGSAVPYVGDAVGGVDGEDSWITGSATFEVNFGAKTLSGSLLGWNNDAMKPITITNAQISGNTFSLDGDVEVKGMFYGENAAELGGVVNTTQDGHVAGAAFGAIKQ